METTKTTNAVAKSSTKPATKPATKTPAKKTPVKTTRKSTLTAKDFQRIYKPAAHIAWISIFQNRSQDKSYTADERKDFAARAKEQLKSLTKTERARFNELQAKKAKKAA